MLKQGQQADITVAFDSLEERHVSLARVQLYVIIKDVRNRSAADQQVDQLLKTRGKKTYQKTHSVTYLFPTDW